MTYRVFRLKHYVCGLQDPGGDQWTQWGVVVKDIYGHASLTVPVYVED